MQPLRDFRGQFTSLTLPKGLAPPLVSITSGVREDLPKLSFGDSLCRPRHPRIHVAGLLYHLMARRNNMENNGWFFLLLHGLPHNKKLPVPFLPRDSAWSRFF